MERQVAKFNRLWHKTTGCCLKDGSGGGRDSEYTYINSSNHSNHTPSNMNASTSTTTPVTTRMATPTNITIYITIHTSPWSSQSQKGEEFIQWPPYLSDAQVSLLLLCHCTLSKEGLLLQLRKLVSNSPQNGRGAQGRNLQSSQMWSLSQIQHYREEAKALKELRLDKDRVIPTVDRWMAMVVLNTQDYINKA